MFSPQQGNGNYSQDGDGSYCCSGDPLAVYKCVKSTRCTQCWVSNLHNIACQSYLNKAGRKRKLSNFPKVLKNQVGPVLWGNFKFLGWLNPEVPSPSLYFHYSRSCNLLFGSYQRLVVLFYFFLWQSVDFFLMHEMLLWVHLLIPVLQSPSSSHLGNHIPVAPQTPANVWIFLSFTTSILSTAGLYNYSLR